MTADEIVDKIIKLSDDYMKNRIVLEEVQRQLRILRQQYREACNVKSI